MGKKVRLEVSVDINYGTLFGNYDGLNAIMKFTQKNSEAEVVKHHIEEVLLKELIAIGIKSNDMIKVDAKYYDVVEPVETEENIDYPVPEPEYAYDADVSDEDVEVVEPEQNILLCEDVAEDKTGFDDTVEPNFSEQDSNDAVDEMPNPFEF